MRSPRAADVLVILNPVAPRYPAEEIRRAIDVELRRRGLCYRIVEVPTDRGAREVVERECAQALEQGCSRIVAVGGDGTGGMVGGFLARDGRRGHQAALGIVPTGTANVLAHELGLPTALGAAIAVAVDAQRTLEIDGISVAGRYVWTQVGIGPDALMIRDTPRERQVRLGRLAYMISYARRALGYRARHFTLDVDGEEKRARAWQVVVANVGSVGMPPFTWGPSIDPTDRRLDLCIYNARTVRERLLAVWRVITGRHRRDASTQYYPVRERVKIQSDRPLLVQGDGELIGHTPVTLEVVPRVLRVLVARPIQGDRSSEAPPATPEAIPVAGAQSPPAAPSLGPPEGSVARDVEKMIAQRSRTWVLQGPLRHPIANLEALDAALFLRVNKVFLGAAADRALWTTSRIMHYGEGWALVALVMLAVDFRAGLRAMAEALPVLWLTMLTVNYPMKKLFRRRRPYIAFVKARVIGPKPRDFSFPSGHAAAGFAGALLLGSHLPAWSPLFYGIALAVSFSRVYLGVHYPSDIAMGGLVGTILAVVYRALLRALVPGLG